MNIVLQNGLYRSKSVGGYILITAARNEQAHISATFDAVAQQTVQPALWMICINDSTDQTSAIVKRHVARNAHILSVDVNLGGSRSFANKAIAINSGFARIEHHSFEYVGVLDADISFGPRYYEILLRKFEDRACLGIAAGTHVEVFPNGSERVLRQPPDIAVCGAQFFRRQCFSQIGGFCPLKWGGEDTLAGVIARQQGWSTETFDDIEYRHLRQMGTEAFSVLMACARNGIRDKKLGMHPAYAFLKFMKRMKESPQFVGTLAWLAGFTCAFGLPNDHNIAAKHRCLFRREQLIRLRSVLGGKGRK